jgi:protocatechuate 3,4-dioxygenase beta subunit
MSRHLRWVLDGSFVLPFAKTDQEGEYRFKSICPGRYAVVVADENAGYPDSSPEINEFLYGFAITEVRLTAENPQAELPVSLPPKPEFIQIHITNRETKAEVLKFTVRLEVPGQQKRPEISFEFDTESKDREIMVPPDKDVVFRVTADEFQEWNESAGPGTLIRVPSGTKTTLEIELEPLK